MRVGALKRLKKVISENDLKLRRREMFAHATILFYYNTQLKDAVHCHIRLSFAFTQFNTVSKLRFGLLYFDQLIVYKKSADFY